MLFVAKSHIGLVRQINEDVCAVHPEFEPMQLILVADGIGGASAGEVASQLAADAVSRYVHQGLQSNGFDPVTLMRDAVATANSKVWNAAKANEDYEGMGTTLVAALFGERQVVFAHVGDSRGYVFHTNYLRQVTRDHSLVAELVRRGQLTPEEAAHHPQRNVVTRSLGTTNASQVDVDVINWAPGDALLLCTDGLTDLVSESELLAHMNKLPAAKTQQAVEAVADSLIELALERGAPDNITLVLVVHREEAGQ